MKTGTGHFSETRIGYASVAHQSRIGYAPTTHQTRINGMYRQTSAEG